MTASSEMTYDDVTKHAHAIMAAKTEGQFVVAFAAYVKDVVERETDPYEKIALFVCGMLEGQRDGFEERLKQGMSKAPPGGMD